MLAPNIGACFRDERNSTYNPGIAEQEGAELFYVPGLCPIDLLHYAMQHDLLSEVTFPFEDGRRVLHENWDFIARRYLGKYYNEDFMKKSGNSSARPGSGRPKASGGKKPSGKRIGKSKPSKANNQLNRRVK